ncbi:hypothetical protein HRR83_009042 [Exophiala dermatitidis]|uniref:Preprotein translocase YidC subunit n=2 Tax=Exophiala dermatitidis TaxID=5970 RepID=H6BWJ2_EXODN|nr:preprotein translocase YidC subunit [Exophiala dermatitidis NIH/UT8656]KAJ4503206.1 hypothetical protein HRR73_009217 [Exophiala dermatitidis]EHY55238.1 preprotein translocase YidC subunit [Exophiala dermatitidis NIH/UT8656]KAJ4506129.1 hypothetical protein HRR75_006984 [Exophiala dermatitidis]KAJ4508215.1 hypothetical protein HRR74_007614 [Exophiala dermatitidis]KAJ4533216.1 hypothetical protein HRR77_008749 [Exophiala dermatitidis]
MASRSEQSPSPPHDLSASQLTIPSDSEAYSSISPPSSSPPQSSDNNGAQNVIIYQPPTLWGILRGAAINLLLPFVNGMMLGFGELLAHEFAFRLGWSGTNVWPRHRSSHSIGPGIEQRDAPVERRRRGNSTVNPELADLASLE